MVTQYYAIRFHLYNASETGPGGKTLETGHANITLFDGTESPHYGINVAGGDDTSLVDLTSNIIDGFKGKDTYGWQGQGRAMASVNLIRVM